MAYFVFLILLSGWVADKNGGLLKMLFKDLFTSSNIQVYHGSDTLIEQPKIIQPVQALDFGIGFYTTTNIEEYKYLENLSSYDIIQMFSDYNIFEYIIKHYDSLHTMSGRAIADDINLLIKRKERD